MIFSAKSATLFAIREAIIAYAEVTPFVGFSPATEYAFLDTGAALCCAGFVKLLPTAFVAPTPGFFNGARGVDGFLGIVPLIDGLWICVAIVKGCYSNEKKVCNRAPRNNWDFYAAFVGMRLSPARNLANSEVCGSVWNASK